MREARIEATALVLSDYVGARILALTESGGLTSDEALATWQRVLTNLTRPSRRSMAFAVSEALVQRATNDLIESLGLNV